MFQLAIYNIKKKGAYRMTTIKDISKELGIGVSTVSMALNDNPKISKKTRELVQAKAKEMKYVKNGAAFDLQQQKTNLILLVVNDASRYFFSLAIRSFQSAISKHGYDFIISTTYGGSTKTAEKFIKERRTDAVIVYTMTIDDQLLAEVASENFPIFVVGHKANVENPNVYSFMYNKKTMTSVGTDYLLDKGFERVGYVKGFHQSYGTVRGLNGYKLSLDNHGIDFDESLVFDANGNESKDGYNVTKEVIIPNIDKLDGIVYANDDIASGGMEAFNELGIKIPDKVSVIGQHNIPQSAMTNPPLTTVAAKNQDDGYYEKLVDYLIDKIEGRENLELRD